MEFINYQKIIESLGIDLEEKIFQLSQFRLVAETASKGLQDSNYFWRICQEFTDIFTATMCCFYWLRQREPAGWYLDAWASMNKSLQPLREMIPLKEEGIFRQAIEKNRPIYLENVDPASIQSISGVKPDNYSRLALIPLPISVSHLGMTALIDPTLNLSTISIKRYFDILHNVIFSGVNNRLFYKNLQNSEEEFRDLIENSSDMVIVAYPDGIIRDCNQVFIKTLGLTFDPRQHHLSELISEFKNDVFQDCWQQLLRGEEVRNVDIYLKKKDEVVETELSGNVRKLPGGEVGIIRLYLRDVTERRESERKRRQLEREVELTQQQQLAQIGLFASGIAHNLQNPVQILIGQINILKAKGLAIPGLEILERASQTILRITKNLILKMSQEHCDEITDIKINELLQTELTFLNANYFYKNEVEKETSFDQNLPCIRGVYSDFSQAIMNLVYNALDAIIDSEKKVLSITTRYLEEE